MSGPRRAAPHRAPSRWSSATMTRRSPGTSDKLGFALAEDVDLGGGKRWVTVAPAIGRRAAAAGQGGRRGSRRRRIGNQTGGRVFLFLETDDFARDHAAMLAKGVDFQRSAAPRSLWHGGGFRRPLRQSLGPDRAEALAPGHRFRPARSPRTARQAHVAFCGPPAYIAISARAHRLAVRTPPSHGGNRGSIPLGRTRFPRQSLQFSEKLLKTWN